MEEYILLQVTNLSVDVLKVHPRNQEFFDDIEGEAYEKFRKSIEQDGILTPLTVAPDMTIISGHQRYKACVDLGINLVPVIIREELTDENEKLKKLLAANFGRLKNNPVKQGKVYAEYEKLCGIQHGGDRGASGQIVRLPTQEDIAKELGVDARTIRRLKRLQSLSPELQQLIEDGTVKYTTALNVWSKLPNEDQQKLIKELGSDYIKTLTGKETQELIELRQKYSKLQEINRQIAQEKESLLNSKNKIPEDIAEQMHKLNRELKSYKEMNSKLEKEYKNEINMYKIKNEQLQDKLNSEDYELKKLKEKQEKMKYEAHISMFDLQIKINNFIKESAPSIFLQGAMAVADPNVKRELMESAKALEDFINKLKDTLSMKDIDYIDITIK